ncbi:opt oligopeptide transporter family [Plakobranchus ocellatus]|uniref:Opt oligopeptide transporter family n=1 Tax=Plakobranchus ocellatus TaxID=259542 RepID=A0AAV4BIT7_9GAST|nr:opt oligopeptide transporter family [Plakobranchus ocellatus]
MTIIRWLGFWLGLFVLLSQLTEPGLGFNFKGLIRKGTTKITKLTKPAKGLKIDVKGLTRKGITEINKLTKPAKELKVDIKDLVRKGASKITSGSNLNINDILKFTKGQDIQKILPGFPVNVPSCKAGVSTCKPTENQLQAALAAYLIGQRSVVCNIVKDYLNCLFDIEDCPLHSMSDQINSVLQPELRKLGVSCGEFVPSSAQVSNARRRQGQRENSSPREKEDIHRGSGQGNQHGDFQTSGPKNGQESGSGNSKDSNTKTDRHSAKLQDFDPGNSLGSNSQFGPHSKSGPGQGSLDLTALALEAVDFRRVFPNFPIDDLSCKTGISACGPTETQKRFIILSYFQKQHPVICNFFKNVLNCLLDIDGCPFYTISDQLTTILQTQLKKFGISCGDIVPSKRRVSNIEENQDQSRNSQSRIDQTSREIESRDFDPPNRQELTPKIGQDFDPGNRQDSTSKIGQDFDPGNGLDSTSKIGQDVDPANGQDSTSKIGQDFDPSNGQDSTSNIGQDSGHANSQDSTSKIGQDFDPGNSQDSTSKIGQNFSSGDDEDSAPINDQHSSKVRGQFLPSENNGFSQAGVNQRSGKSNGQNSEPRNGQAFLQLFRGSSGVLMLLLLVPYVVTVLLSPI